MQENRIFLITIILKDAEKKVNTNIHKTTCKKEADAVGCGVCPVNMMREFLDARDLICVCRDHDVNARAKQILDHGVADVCG